MNTETSRASFTWLSGSYLEPYSGRDVRNEGSSKCRQYYSEIKCGLLGLQYMYPILNAGLRRREEFPCLFHVSVFMPL